MQDLGESLEDWQNGRLDGIGIWLLRLRGGEADDLEGQLPVRAPPHPPLPTIIIM